MRGNRSESAPVERESLADLAADWPGTWASKTKQGKETNTFCLRFHRGDAGCSAGDKCRFPHRCPVGLADGSTCGARGSANKHAKHVRGKSGGKGPIKSRRSRPRPAAPEAGVGMPVHASSDDNLDGPPLEVAGLFRSAIPEKMQAELYDLLVALEIPSSRRESVRGAGVCVGLVDPPRGVWCLHWVALQWRLL